VQWSSVEFGGRQRTDRLDSPGFTGIRRLGRLTGSRVGTATDFEDDDRLTLIEVLDRRR
jgi:hypothetical protein